MTRVADLRSFWWFREGQVAGLGRPGFNARRWNDLPQDERALFTWLGNLRTTAPSRADLHAYLDEYRSRVGTFMGYPPRELDETLAALRAPDALAGALGRLQASTGLLESVPTISSDLAAPLGVRPSRDRIRAELDLLADSGVEIIVALNEAAPDPVVADSGLEVHHLPVPDLMPPRPEQVERFATILAGALDARRAIAVHCAAGVGRTTTMIVAGFVSHGEPLHSLEAQVKQINPTFLFKGAQWEFVQRLAGLRSST